MRLARPTLSRTWLTPSPSGRSLQTVLVILLLLSTAIASSGCIASGMAARGYDPGAAWLQPGVARADVDRNLGKPLTESRLPDGRVVATCEYGRNRPNRGVEVMHAFLEGVTFGLWDMPGGAIELARAKAGERVKVTVTYGEDDRVVSVEY